MSITLESILKQFSNSPIQILDKSIPIDSYITIDLSSNNKDLSKINITNHLECQAFIDTILQQHNAQVAYGGYLEKRNLYASSSRFSSGLKRDIHLGIDFWCKARTNVIVPIPGKIYGFKNNDDSGNYGPTIILEHKLSNQVFYTLYGHLSLESLNDMYIGKEFSKGETLATLGTPAINVNYAPHLHFQIIRDMENYKGDYPGVCHYRDLDFYKNNCPNPNYLLKL